MSSQVSEPTGTNRLSEVFFISGHLTEHIFVAVFFIFAQQNFMMVKMGWNEIVYNELKTTPHENLIKWPAAMI